MSSSLLTLTLFGLYVALTVIFGLRWYRDRSNRVQYVKSWAIGIVIVNLVWIAFHYLPHRT